MNYSNSSTTRLDSFREICCGKERHLHAQKAVREAVIGRHYLSASLSERAIENYIEKSKEAYLDPYDSLTTREREVLHLAAQSCSNAEIAERLYISRRTVEVHRANVMHKLGLRSQPQLIRYAMKRGILPPDDSLDGKTG